MNTINLIKSTAVSGLLLALSSVPAFADTTITVSGNGSESKTEVEVVQTQQSAVMQTNDVKIENAIMVSNSTGGNKIEGTTGGDSSIESGNTTTTVTVSNTAGSNIANNPCGCQADPATVEIKVKNNGTKSNNKVEFSDLTSSMIGQSNKTALKTGVALSSTTGKNKIKNTTSGGSEIKGGSTNTSVMVTNMAGSNVYGVPAI